MTSSSPRHQVAAALKLLLEGLPTMAPTFLVIALLACVLLPLPTALVDLLLSMSLAGSVLLLAVSLTIGRTSDFIGFPALLLLATLFRLTLNISTTRLILSQGYAGQVIEAFAGVVVRGDLIVGGVMFLIITIVQFVVIARGAERVAEVGARFALDALPGHQAAIDADLRAGVISSSEAARRRAALSDRSSFYGAMDGTVRFVRGDAVAGLAITFINLIGGIAVGLARQDLSWSQSLALYGRLTIGDGLLSQIPALLVSLAAGILVARVDRAEPQTQFRWSESWFRPSVFAVPAVLLLGLAFSSQMPRAAFTITALCLSAVALVFSLRIVSEREAQLVPSHARTINVHLLQTDIEDPRALERALAEVRLQCATALGLQIPPIRLLLELGGVPGRLELKLEGRSLGRTTLGDGSPYEDQIVIGTYRFVMESAASLVDLEDIDRRVEELRVSHPVIVRRALAVVELTDVLAVVRGFLAERVPLPPLGCVLGVLAEGERFRDTRDRMAFPELVRARLADHWVRPILDGLRAIGPVQVVRLTPDAEAELLEALGRSDDAWLLKITSAERERWLQALGAGTHERTRSPLLVLASPQARRAVSLLMVGVTPHVPVLSVTELASARESTGFRWVDVPSDSPMHSPG